MTDPHGKTNKMWFEEGDNPARIAQYNDLHSRNQGKWLTEAGVNGVRGILLADGAIWRFGAEGCPEMIRSGPISPDTFLSIHEDSIAKAELLDDGPPITIAKGIAKACARLRALGYTAIDTPANTSD